MLAMLTSMVEWIAIMVLSTWGIDYTPLPDCDAVQPAEFRQIAWSPDQNSLSLMQVTGCEQTSPVRIEHGVVYFGDPVDLIDS